MSPLDIRGLAAELLTSRERSQLLPPPTARDSRFDLQAAYAVAAELVRSRRERGHRPVGRKIGFTNKAIWARLGLATPIWAHIYESTVHHAPHNAAALPLAGMVAPRIEPEIVFKVRSVLPAGAKDPTAILQAVEWMALAFEIVDCHYPDWKFEAADAVADFGLHAALVIGEPRAVEGQGIAQVAAHLHDFRVRLQRDGKTVAEGAGENVLESPALALAYLADVVRSQPAAEPLSAGELVTTGTLTSALSVRAGETWTAEVTVIELPRLTVAFTP